MATPDKGTILGHLEEVTHAASGIDYDDSVTPLGSTNVQGAIDALHTLILAADTLQEIYNNSNPARIVVNSTNGGLTLRDAATPIGADLFAVQNNAGSSIYFAVDASQIDIGRNLIPNANNTYDIGSSTFRFRNTHVDGTANLYGDTILDGVDSISYPGAGGTGLPTNYSMALGGGSTASGEGGFVSMYFYDIGDVGHSSNNVLNIDFGAASTVAGFSNEFTFTGTAGSLVYEFAVTSTANVTQFVRSDNSGSGLFPLQFLNNNGDLTFTTRNTNNINLGCGQSDTVTSGPTTADNNVRIFSNQNAGAGSPNQTLTFFDAGNFAGDGQIIFGQPGLTGPSGTAQDAFVRLVGPAITTISTAQFAWFKKVSTNAVTLNANKTTVASMWLQEPNITTAGFTLTNSATLYIETTADEATNNYAIWSNSGAVNRFDGNLQMFGDNVSVVWGAGLDASAYYDGTDLFIDPQLVGSGRLRVLSGLIVNQDLEDRDSIISGDTVTNLIFVDASVDNVGINQGTPTASLHIGAGTATKAPLKLTSGTSLTTPEAGSVEYDGKNLSFTRQTKRWNVAMSNDSVTSSTTVANTTTETTVFTGTISANAVAAGNVIRNELAGHYSTANATDTFTLRWKINGTTILSMTSDAANVTNAPFHSDLIATIRTIGAGGTLIGHGTIDSNNTGHDTSNTATTAIDTTATMTFTITVQWSAANVSNTFTSTIGFSELI